MCNPELEGVKRNALPLGKRGWADIGVLISA